MARIVISGWGSYGDVNPYLGLALALRARGHTRVLAIPSYYRAAVEAVGAHVREEDGAARAGEAIDEVLRQVASR